MSPERNDGLHGQPPVSAANSAPIPAAHFATHFSINPPAAEADGGGGGAAPQSSLGDRPQVWIIGTRDQVVHLMNEFYVKKIASDRAKFTPIIPAPFAKDKFMTVLVR
ncbi:MAG: hypothetical protein SNJ57_03470 [Cyanobacteriota bacterium]